MADCRDIDAWLAAARMDDSVVYMFVEGSSDVNFWKRFVNPEVVMLEPANGWPNVVEWVRRFDGENLEKNCLGIIDSDFEYIHPHKKITERNIFLTDYHDEEMMICMSDAWDAAILSIDTKNKLKVSPEQVRRDVLDISDEIGYLKLASLCHGLNLVLKKQNKKHEIELPKYENFIKSDNGSFDSEEKMIVCLYGFNLNQNGPKHEKGKVMEAYRSMKTSKIRSELLSNGHDVIYIIPYVLRRKYGLNETVVKEDTVEVALKSAYSFDMLKSTGLYNSLSAWSKEIKRDIFLVV